MDKLQAEVEKQIIENEKQVLKELKNNYNNLLDMLKVLKDANLDIPVRETFGGFSIDKEKMIECPRIVIK